QPTDSSPIWLLPGRLARCLRYTFPRTRNEDELRLRAILILAIIAISAPAQQMPELRVSLGELTGEAIKNSPDIAAAQKRYEAARQRPTQESSLLNRAVGTPVGRPEDVKPKELTATLEELFAAARQNSPMLGRDQKMTERSELAVNMARKEYYPDVTLNAGYYFMGGMPPMYEVRADFKVPVYFWRKQRAGVNEQVSNLSQSRRTYEATDQSLRYQIQDDFLMAQSSARLMKLYTQTVVPQGNLALESSLSTYETG